MAETDIGQFRPRGELKELALLFFPILVTVFSTYFMLFVEQLLLVRFSTQAMEVAITASYPCQVFLGPSLAIAMMAQVFVGRWYGAGQLDRIGPGVWQFIWFSCLSLLATVPLSWLGGTFYFRGTPIETIGLSYFHYSMGISFLFPLAATLSCFYLGQGQTRFILFATLGSQGVKFLTACLLIFGWGWIPSFGLMGALISTVIAQGSFCLFLLWRFLQPKRAAIYHSHAWRFQPKLFWECIQPGLLRGGSRLLTFTSWAMIARLMTARGGDYLLILSIGGTLFAFLPFLGDAICQAQTTIVAQILGGKEYWRLHRTFWAGMTLVALVVCVVSIPLALFPSITFSWIFPAVVLSQAAIQKVFLGVLLCFALFAFAFVSVSYVLAFKDTKASLFIGACNWIDGFLLMYLMMEFAGMKADQFWLVLSLMHFASGALYFLRMRWLISDLEVKQVSALLTR